MAIRMSGMISGMDTDSIIKELMSAKSAKKTKLEQQKTKLEWKQEKWADLNTKLYKLYTDQISKVRMAGNYSTKKVTSSNENIVTATAATSAGSGTHTIEIKSIASAQYITGDKVKIDGGLKASDSLVDKEIMSEGIIIRVTSVAGSNTTVKNLEVTKNTTINDMLNIMKEAGLNASFDESQGRFFISGKTSGENSVFSIETYKMNGTAGTELTSAANNLKDKIGLTDTQVESYKALLEDLDKKQSVYLDDSIADKVTAWNQLQAAKQKVLDMEESFYTQAAKNVISNDRLLELKDAANGLGEEDVKALYKNIKDAVQKSYYKLDAEGNILDSLEFSDTAIQGVKSTLIQEATSIINKKMNSGEKVYDDPNPAVNEENRLKDIEKEYIKLYKEVNNGGTEEDALNILAEKSYQKSLDTAISNTAIAYASSTEAAQAVDDKIIELKNSSDSDSVKYAINKYKSAYNDYLSAPVAIESGLLNKLGLADMKLTITDGKATVSSDKDTAPSGFILKPATDASIILDGAVMTVEGNTFSAAGVTYSLKGAQVGTTVSVSVTNDTQAVYDMVKGFVKAYNSILEEMNKLYNASSAKGYDPLTDDEKEAMSDSQVELWEGKIKDSLLRRDDTLGSVINTLRTNLQGGITVDGKNYSLASLGIVTGVYTEKGILHIEGDSEDSTYSSKKNKLMEALTSDPEAVANALSGMFGKLSSAMQDKMKSSSISSALTFYNDKEMKKQVTQYTKDISTWETRLQDMENRYYKQFSAMETALAKIQSSSNNLANLLGS